MAFTQVIKTLGSVMASMKTAVDTWLSQNITNPSNPPLDRSLSLSNACAPADMVGDLKNDLQTITGVSEIAYTRNTYVRTADDPITLTQQSQSGFDSAIVTCQAGDVFTVSGRGAAAAHIAEFTDANGNKLSGGITNTGANITNRLITAPTNAAYLVLNNYRTNYPDAVSYKGEFVVDAINALDTRVDNAEANITGLESQLSVTEYFNPNDFEVSSISPSTGENVTDSTRIRSKTYLDDGIIAINGTDTNQVMLFAYNSDTYVGVWNGTSFGTTASWFNSITMPTSYNYKYRLLIKNDSRETPIAIVVVRISYTEPSIYSLQKDVAELQEQENTDRIYIASDDIAKAQTASAVFALYDALVTSHPDYVSKNTLTSGSLTNYEYVFDSGNYNAGNGQRQKDSVVPKPVLLITTGVHGNEPAAVMSAYTIFKALCENKNSISRIRNDFVFKVVPVVVPWGYDNDKRWNENGVNINRNFDAGWVAEGEPYSNSYSGESAASENETKIIQAWITANPNAAFLIDFHNSGYQSEVSYLGIVAGETYSDPVRWAYRYGINDVIGHWQKDRNINGTSVIYGYTGAMQIGGSAQYYAQQTIPSATFETSNNQNGEGLNSTATIGIGAEAFAALIIGMTDKYFRA